MGTPRFLRTAAPTFTDRYAGMEAGMRDAWSRGLHDPFYNIKRTAANNALTVQVPVSSVDIGGGQILTFTAPKSYGALYKGGRAVGSEAEATMMKHALGPSYLDKISI